MNGFDEALPTEVRELHTGILRCTLNVDESQTFWERARPDDDVRRRSLRAFEERWFGSKSEARVNQLLVTLASRFATQPRALRVLRAWGSMTPSSRRLVCHWHLQFADPLYRRFTAEMLPARRLGARASIDRDVVSRWVEEQASERWGASTRNTFGSKLLTAAAEAGLVGAGSSSRPLLTPRVDDDALVYLMRWLRTVRVAGSLLDNAYVASVGLDLPTLEARLRALPELTYRRMGEVVELDWNDAAAPATRPPWASQSEMRQRMPEEAHP